MIRGANGPEVSDSQGVYLDSSVSAIRLSQAGALAAWSVGWGGALVDVDVNTCEIRNSMPLLFGRECLRVTTDMVFNRDTDAIKCQ